jgi:hypothetical protein
MELKLEKMPKDIQAILDAFKDDDFGIVLDESGNTIFVSDVIGIGDLLDDFERTRDVHSGEDGSSK